MCVCVHAQRPLSDEELREKRKPVKSRKVKRAKLKKEKKRKKKYGGGGPYRIRTDNLPYPSDGPGRLTFIPTLHHEAVMKDGKGTQKPYLRTHWTTGWGWGLG